jgi:hypothetical protein
MLRARMVEAAAPSACATRAAMSRSMVVEATQATVAAT